ncbi:hypothetical protein T484DRAFT_1749962 [Baffinella frigidus]|nr:hypothetical protein T484DRAFT_1749962 [Cryptophyta sp. CCMP2293]
MDEGGERWVGERGRGHGELAQRPLFPAAHSWFPITFPPLSKLNQSRPTLAASLERASLVAAGEPQLRHMLGNGRGATCSAVHARFSLSAVPGPGVCGRGIAWRKREKGEDRAERLSQVLDQVVSLHEKQAAMTIWRLNATKMRASALAVWAVDQGNRKAYEVED